MLTRKAFIYNNMMAAGTLFAGSSLFSEMIVDEKAYRLTVLHTNDVHSRIDPFPMDGGVNQGLGGVAARAEIIEKYEERKSMFYYWMLVIYFKAPLILIFIKANPK